MCLVNLDDLKELQLADGIRARVVNTNTVSVAHVHLEAGAVLPEHTHHHEQTVNVLEGELELVVEGKPIILKRGLSMVLPPMVPHSGKALTDAFVMDIFHPVREDFVAMAEGKAGPNPYD
jgi:quercetin dioxygenase-like cupin family protein